MMHSQHARWDQLARLRRTSPPVALALTEQGELAADPDVELTGIPEVNADGDSMNEIAYEAANRPTWIGVPLAGMARLVAQITQKETGVRVD